LRRAKDAEEESVSPYDADFKGRNLRYVLGKRRKELIFHDSQGSWRDRKKPSGILTKGRGFGDAKEKARGNLEAQRGGGTTFFGGLGGSRG